ncbi:MAG: hypothetical protein GW949_05390 [Spirochaetales bacterium]|nr:hypothetical protein [Spirochaetales bacterium]
MSQLGTYLRVGGQELKYVVTKFRVSEERSLGGISRKEPRKILLYNLEVFTGDTRLGNLGDLSFSGLPLYREIELVHGKAFEVSIRLPLGFGETTELQVRITPRRTHYQRLRGRGRRTRVSVTCSGWYTVILCQFSWALVFCSL